MLLFNFLAFNIHLVGLECTLLLVMEKTWETETCLAVPKAEDMGLCSFFCVFFYGRYLA